MYRVNDARRIDRKVCLYHKLHKILFSTNKHRHTKNKEQRRVKLKINPQSVLLAEKKSRK